MQTRERRGDVAALTGPEELRGGRGTRPDGGVEVVRVGLFGPEEVLACGRRRLRRCEVRLYARGLTSEDELAFGRGQVGERVEGVGELP